MICTKNIADIDFNDPLYFGASKATQIIEQPDAHYQWLNHNKPTACASLWWTNTPNYNGESTGLIGHFHCKTAHSGAALLTELKKTLFEKGVSWVIGPINGSSWFSYRLALEPIPKPAFLFEPWQPPEHLQAFEQAQFQVIERYFSSVQRNIEFHDPRTDTARARLLSNNIQIRNIDPIHVETELLNIYRLCLDCFADNLFYRPISFETFANLYRDLLNKVPPPFCKLAFHDEQLVGILFTYPDNGRLVVKTSAVKNLRACAGLSIVLMDEVTQVAKAAGLSEVIFALMHTKNKTLNSTTDRSQPFRHYGLLGVHR